MVEILHDADAPLTPLDGKRVAVIGYGNQGSAWAQNLRDSGVAVVVGTISDSSRETALAVGFEAHEIPDAVRGSDVVCLLIPDEVMAEVVARDVVPNLREGAAVCFASGYAPAFGEAPLPEGADVVMVAPRMLGVGVREGYVDGNGFVAFFGVERDATGNARPLCLAIARGIGATRRGVLEMTAHQEAVIDLFMEQGIAPGVAAVWREAALALLEQGIPLEAIMVEFVLSGEIERAYRALREIGYTKQMALHSQTSQYGTLSRADRFADIDVGPRLRKVLEEITGGAFAREWAAEREAGYPRLAQLRASDARELLADTEDEIRAKFTPPAD